MTTRHQAVIAVVVLLSLVVAGGAAGADAAERGSLVNAEFTDTVEVFGGPDRPHAWESEPNTLNVTFETTAESTYYEVCVYPEGNESGSCTTKRVGKAKTVSANVSFANLSAAADRNLTVELYQRVDAKLVLADSMRVDPVVVAKDGDLDNDQLTNLAERQNGTSMYRSDTDQDSLSDGSEVKNYGTSPLLSDTDDDGLTDAQELELGTDPLSRDTDGDGLRDSVETRLGTDPTQPNSEEVLLASVLLVGAVVVGSGVVVLSSVRAVLARVVAGLTAAGARLRPGASADDEAETPVDDEAAADDPPPDSRTASTGPDGDAAGTEAVAAGAEAVAGESKSAAGTEAAAVDRPNPVISDEEVVVRLLRDNDGWLYQSEIVEARDWSKSKVSRLLSTMEESGRIQKITVGRQNVIAETGSVPEGLESPFGE
jgi:uncharacterized membrane protein